MNLIFWGFGFLRGRVLKKIWIIVKLTKGQSGTLIFDIISIILTEFRKSGILIFNKNISIILTGLSADFTWKNGTI